MESKPLQQSNKNWIELPFNTCSTKEIKLLTAQINHNRILNRNYPHIEIRKLLNELPFQGCTDYEILVNCLSSNNKFLEQLENNNLSKNIIRQIPTLQENFSCKYQNEQSFQNMLKNINQNH